MAEANSLITLLPWEALMITVQAADWPLNTAAMQSIIKIINLAE